MRIECMRRGIKQNAGFPKWQWWFLCLCVWHFVVIVYLQMCQLVSLLFSFLWNRFKRFLAKTSAIFFLFNCFIRAFTTQRYIVDCFDYFNCNFHGGINRFVDRQRDHTMFWKCLWFNLEKKMNVCVCVCVAYVVHVMAKLVMIACGWQSSVLQT